MDEFDNTPGLADIHLRGWVYFGNELLSHASRLHLHHSLRQIDDARGAEIVMRLLIVGAENLAEDFPFMKARCRFALFFHYNNK